MRNSGSPGRQKPQHLGGNLKDGFEQETQTPVKFESDRLTQTPYSLKEDKSFQSSVVMISRETQASKVKKNSTEVK
jgi:hypothetical protein